VVWSRHPRHLGRGTKKFRRGRKSIEGENGFGEENRKKIGEKETKKFVDTRASPPIVITRNSHSLTAAGGKLDQIGEFARSSTIASWREREGILGVRKSKSRKDAEAEYSQRSFPPANGCDRGVVGLWRSPERKGYGGEKLKVSE